MLFADIVLPREVRGLLEHGYRLMDLRTGKHFELPACAEPVTVNLAEPGDDEVDGASTQFRGDGHFGQDTGEMLRRFIKGREWSKAMALLTQKQIDLLQAYHTLGFPSHGVFAATLNRSENPYGIRAKDLRLLPNSIYRCFAYQKKQPKLTHNATDRVVPPFVAWSFDIQVFSTPSTEHAHTWAGMLQSMECS